MYRTFSTTLSNFRRSFDKIDLINRKFKQTLKAYAPQWANHTD